MQPVLASGLLQVSAWPEKTGWMQGADCSDPVRLAGLLEGDWPGHRLTGQLSRPTVRSGLLPPPWASGSGLTQEAASEQSRLALWVWFILFCLRSS